MQNNMRVAWCLSSLTLIAIFLAREAESQTSIVITDLRVSTPDLSWCDPVLMKKKCLVEGSIASALTSGGWTMRIHTVPKNSAIPTDAEMGANGKVVGISAQNADGPWSDYVYSKFVDMRTEVDVYVQPKTNDADNFHASDIIKVPSGTCSCPPPPTISNVTLGSVACEDPKKKICEVTFDVTLAPEFDEAKVYAIALNSSVDAPTSYADFKDLDGQEPDPRVDKKFTSNTTGGSITRNITNGQDGEYKIYIGGKTKGGWFSDITTLDACECPMSPSPGSLELSTGDDVAEEGLPLWVIVIIIVVSLIILCIIIFVIAKKKKKEKPKKKTGTGQGGAPDTAEMTA